ncbi:hypothetical protein ASZ90_003448 [hydrocarbon metagenome]|uniref:Uncharacterized protein n=1 Tax=hydrocarbon metagenome TaxID=938273 RepID=A0A0W8G2F3_9ZZZZ
MFEERRNEFRSDFKSTRTKDKGNVSEANEKATRLNYERNSI